MNPRATHKLIAPPVRAFALLGGVGLLALVAMVCLSALGALALKFATSAWAGAHAAGLAQAILDSGIGPFKASFEIVEHALPPIVFAFLPLVQLRRAHAQVDIFVQRLPSPARRVLELLWQALAALLLAVIAWRLEAGMQSKMRAGDTTFLLHLPVWWAYAACLPGAALGALTAATLGLRAVLEGRDV
ncbi:TRAP transporter small permease [Pseudothioclava arenosa]|uniref:TRAP transporter small permease protein n=1 Tax=Pseudothioclava arenosa TaxID=1795308 RepID=A0A2A4CTQ2_9RHOB|nr:TRAP transporter small permease subunit [Pseudothioclava arenosa]PCD77464.1 C4-dicarboxylate ABC transporter permease [Pseudothioclava arenosa]